MTGGQNFDKEDGRRCHLGERITWPQAWRWDDAQNTTGTAGVGRVGWGGGRGTRSQAPIGEKASSIAVGQNGSETQSFMR